MLAKPGNHGRNLVVVADGLIAGTVTYDRTDEGIGDIGVFAAAGFDRTGVGDVLVDRLIATTEESLQVDIFARNACGTFYRRHGFREHGEEFEHEFRPDARLPVERLRFAREETARYGLEAREQRL
jgi:predicted GNAT family N-acyltransferase